MVGSGIAKSRPLKPLGPVMVAGKPGGVVVGFPVATENGSDIPINPPVSHRCVKGKVIPTPCCNDSLDPGTWKHGGERYRSAEKPPCNRAQGSDGCIQLLPTWIVR